MDLSARKLSRTGSNIGLSAQIWLWQFMQKPMRCEEKVIAKIFYNLAAKEVYFLPDAVETEERSARKAVVLARLERRLSLSET